MLVKLVCHFQWVDTLRCLNKRAFGKISERLFAISLTSWLQVQGEYLIQVLVSFTVQLRPFLANQFH